MTGIFSTVSGQFGKSIIIGSFLPAATFVIAAHLFLVPMLPWQWSLVARIAILEPEWKLAAAVAAATFIAGLLHVLNLSIVRFYEGYPWADGPFGRWKTAKYRKHLKKLEAIRYSARAQRKLIRAANPNDSRLSDLLNVRDEAIRCLRSDYPREASVLPTRLGNVIRCFENYSFDQYRIAAVTMWPRFIARLRPDHAAMIDDAKTSFDVAIHLSLLSGVTGLLMVVAAAVYPIAISSSILFIWLTVRVIAAFLLCSACYAIAIVRARSWGDMVRSVFDLYRGDVLRDFGIEQRPRDLASERAIWQELSQQIIYGDPLNGVAMRYPLDSVVLPANGALLVTKGVITENAASGIRHVRLSVKNTSDQKISDVRVLEHLPAGSEYVWGSGDTSKIAGVNPLTITAGSVAAGETVTFDYKITLAS